MPTNNNKISFALKTTNWCNLKCAHCCECSGPNVIPNIMPLGTVEKYLGEFSALPVDKWRHMVFTGGEAMAPYFHQQMEYVPKCLDMAAAHNMIPFVKTNGTWGADDNMRQRILRDVAAAAYKNNVLMSLDLSVDEFHHNDVAVYNILNDVVRSDYLAPAVRISLCSLNTQASHATFARLIERLQNSGLEIVVNNYGEMSISVPMLHKVSVYYDLLTNVSGAGRAKANNIGAYTPSGRPDPDTGHCFQIDNADIATLNYKYRAPMNGRPMIDVVAELMTKAR